MNKLIKSQRNSKNLNINLQLPPTLTQTSVLEDSNFGSTIISSPNIRKLKKKQSINSKFSKFDFQDRSQFGDADFQQVQSQLNEQNHKENNMYFRKTVRFSSSQHKQVDSSFLKNMPQFKQFQDSNNFSQIECSQIPKKENYQCEFQQTSSPRKLKRQTSFHENNVSGQKQLYKSGRKSSFQAISQQSNSGSLKTSLSQSKKIQKPFSQVSTNKMNLRPHNLQVIQEFNHRNQASFQNSKMQQSKIQDDLQALRQNNTIDIEDALSQAQEQYEIHQQNKLIQDVQTKFNQTSKINQNILNNSGKGYISSSSSSIPSPKILSFGQIQTPKFSNQSRLISKVKSTCQRVLNMDKNNKQIQKQNNKNDLNTSQNLNGFSLKVQKVQNNLPQIKNTNKKLLSTVYQSHQNQSRLEQQKAFELLHELKANTSAQTDLMLNQTANYDSFQDKIKIIKQQYSKRLLLMQKNQQKLKNQISNMQVNLKYKDIQIANINQQNKRLKAELIQKQSRILLCNQQIAKIKKQLKNRPNQNNSDISSYQLKKKQEQWSYLQFKYQKQIKALQQQLSSFNKQKTFQQNNDKINVNQNIQESIQFLKYHQKIVYENMQKVKSQQDLILKEWRELDKAKKYIKSCQQNNNRQSNNVQSQRKYYYY